ncbi:S1 family peptidase [Actinoplanes sp. NPDC051861]|uniref:S1 family peptidase n=1 Tax=Actinoplanes sp. NPDC051861 TaxID=3155170 RepID=UPI003422F9AC
MIRRRGKYGLAGVLAVCVTASALVPLNAGDEGPVRLLPAAGVGETALRTAPGMVDAMQRTFHLTREEAVARIGRGEAARQVAGRARVAAGSAYAGDWLDDDVTAVTVAVTDRAVARAVRAAGANPELVRYTHNRLVAAEARLQGARDVSGTSIDQQLNRIVVESRPGAEPAARAAVSAAAIDPAMVEYRTQRDDAVAATIDHHGGELFTTSKGSCTEGFSVDPGVGQLLNVPGFVTAGHCGPNQDQIRDRNGLFAGVITDSTYANTGRGPDQAWVPLAGLRDPRPDVFNSSTGGFVPVLGSTVAAYNADVCMEGQVSKWRCGKITGYPANESGIPVGPDGALRTVTGVVKTSICSDLGDSGAPVLAGNQAQGIVSFATVNCVTHPQGPTWFQPINGMLNSMRLKLRLPQGSPTPGPRIGGLGCGAFPSLGWYRFKCYSSWYDGTDPVVLSWSSYYSVTPEITDVAGKTATALGACPQGLASTVTLRVTDSQGRQDFMSAPTGCP